MEKRKNFSDVQRVLLCVYLSFSALILIFDHIYKGENMVQYVKYTIILSLFISALAVRKSFPEQWIMTLSLMFVAAADFFLVVLSTFGAGLESLGMLGFFLAYLCLIKVYYKNFKLGRRELLAAAPVAAIFVFMCVFLQPYINGKTRVSAFIFGAVLCCMTWLSVCTAYGSYYGKRAARLMGISGWFMLICDMGVAFSMFYPYNYNAGYVPVLKNMVWGAYVPGWTLLAVIICEKDLREGEKPNG